MENPQPDNANRKVQKSKILLHYPLLCTAPPIVCTKIWLQQQDPATAIFDLFCSLCFQTSNQLVTNRLDTVLEFFRILCLPLGSRSRHGVLASEANEEDIIGIVTMVAIEMLVGEAKVGQRNGGFAGRNATVGVTPDSVMLCDGFGVSYGNGHRHRLAGCWMDERDIPVGHCTRQP